MINVIITGPFGRMGSALCRLASHDPELNLLAGLVSQKAADADTKQLKVYEALEEVPRPDGPVVLVDFTHPDATIQRVKEALELGVPVVIGTTGFSSEQLATIQAAAEQVPIVLSANMSLGVNLLLDVVERLATKLQGYDIEVIETHHRMKKDSPSGTALLFANAAAAGREVDLYEVARHGRSGMTGERTSSEIGIHAVRGGDVVGDHTVLFAGIGERVEISHKASSRDTFAAGALYAARFLAGHASRLYSMKDVLKIQV